MFSFCLSFLGQFIKKGSHVMESVTFRFEDTCVELKVVALL